jgi:RsmE family RNA methyltransferase
MQSGVDARIPPVSVEKRLKVFLEDTLSTLVSENALRIIAEPDKAGKRIADVVRESACMGRLPQEAVLAVGPEGGWMPREVYMLEELFGFQRVTLGNRILRTDCAVLILLGLLHDAMMREQRTSSSLVAHDIRECDDVEST